MLSPVGCLVDAAVARHHAPIQRQTFSGSDAHHASHGDISCRLAQPRAIGLTHLGQGWRQIQYVPDGAACAINRARLDPFGNGVQRHHHGSLGPLPDEESARHRYGHERIDIEFAAQQRLQTLAVHRNTRQRNGQRSYCHAGHRPRQGMRHKEVNAFGQQSKPQRRPHLDQIPAIAARLPRIMCAAITGSNIVCASSNGLHPVPDLRNSSNDQLHYSIRRIHQQGALPQAKLQAANTVDRVQRLADFVFFHYAIHIGNAQPLPRGSGQRCIQIGWHMRMVVMIMAFFMGMASMPTAVRLTRRLICWTIRLGRIRHRRVVVFAAATASTCVRVGRGGACACIHGHRLKTP